MQWRLVVMPSLMTALGSDIIDRLEGCCSQEVGPRTITDPAIHAGHQTHQMTTGVYMPHTFHPNAAFRNTSPTSRPKKAVAENITAVGDTSCNSAEDAYLAKSFLGHGCTKVKGLASSPMKNASEKFNVARADRNMPSRSSEKHLMS